MGNPPRRIQARVPDANRLLNEATASARLKKDIAWVTTLRAGGLRIFVAPHVPAEVEEHLAFRAAKARLDEGLVRGPWRDQIAPRLRVVDPGQLDRVELAAVARRDEDDLPTGALAAILGPGSTWSADRHLLDPGLAEPYLLELVIAIREVSALDIKLVTGAKLGNALVAIGTELGRAVARLDGRGKAVAGMLILGGIAAASVALRRNPEARRHVADALRRVSAEVMRQMAADQALQTQWIGRVPPPLSLNTPRLERAIARALAAAPAPLAADEIAQVLRGCAAGADLAAIRAELRSHPMFLRNGRGQWQLGDSPRLSLALAVPTPRVHSLDRPAAAALARGN